MSNPSRHDPAAPAGGDAQPSDAHVVDQATERLRSDPHAAQHTHSVHIEFNGGRLRLTGAVPSFHKKQALQAALANLPGVELIENQVRVDSGVAGRPPQ